MAVYLGGTKLNVHLNDIRVKFLNTAIDTAIAIEPKTVTVGQGETRQFRAIVNLADNSIPNAVAWILEGSSKSAITSEGLLTVHKDEEAETVFKVRAVLNYNNLFAEAVVTVIELELFYNVVLTPLSVTLDTGDVQQFNAVIETNDDKISKIVTWLLIGAKQSVITQSGLLTVHGGDAGNSFKVRAAMSSDIYSEASVVVNTFIPQFSVVVTPASVEISRGGTQQFMAVVTTNDNSIDKSVIWELIGASSKQTAVSDAGLLTIHNGENRGAVLIVRAAAVYNGAYADAAVTVT